MELIRAAAAGRTGRIASFRHQGHLVWVKRPARPKMKRWHRLQAMAARLVPLAIVRPTVSAGGAEALAREAERLEELRRLGVVVPTILAQGEDMLVLEHLGPSMKQCLEESGTAVQRRRLIRRAGAALGGLHAAGGYHGRPRLEDLAVVGRAIGFLDLEEVAHEVMSLPQAQARDLWLFLVSCARFHSAEEPLLEEALEAYWSAAPPSGVMPELQRLLRLLRPLCWLVNATRAQRYGRDLRHGAAATGCLQRRLL